jgi:hypothetical protein
LLLVFWIPRSNPAFPWTLVAFVSLLAMQLVFWMVTQPVNRHWVAGLQLSDAAQSFFSPGRGATQNAGDDQWKRLRNRWEYSHIVRAVLAVLSLISVTIAIVVYRSR